MIIKKVLKKIKQARKMLKMYRKGNKVILGTKINPLIIKGLNIDFNGQNSLIEIKDTTNFDKCKISLGNDCHIVIESSPHLCFCLIAHNKSSVKIGKNVQIGEATIHMENECNTALVIDDNAILSYNIQIFTTDTHPIFDLQTNKLINNTQSIVHIGKNSWVCANAILLKGTDISKETIVGNASVVTKKFNDSNCIIAGNPAKIVKKNIYWHGGPIS